VAVAVVLTSTPTDGFQNFHFYHHHHHQTQQQPQRRRHQQQYTSGSTTAAFLSTTTITSAFGGGSSSSNRSSNLHHQRRTQQQQQQYRSLSSSLLLLSSTFYDDFEDFDGMIGETTTGGRNDFDNNNNNNNIRNQNVVSSGSDVDNSNNNNININNNNDLSDDGLYAALRRRQDYLRGGSSPSPLDLDPLKNRNMNNNNNNNSQDSESNFRMYSDSVGSNISSRRRGGRNNSNNDEDDDDEDEYERLLYNWREANCISTVRLTLPDWIRKIAIDERLYPLVVCGSASGNLYLADLEEGEELDSLETVHAAQVVVGMDDDRDIGEALTKLFGKYDGGGVLALAIKDDLIVSAGREGGIHVCTIVGEETEVYTGSRGGTARQTKLRLRREGKLRGLEDDSYDIDAPSRRIAGEDANPSISSSAPLITSLAFDNQGTLWVAGYDGILRGYDHEELDADGRPLMVRQKNAEYEIDIGSPIVSMTINNELGCGVASTTTKGVVIFSLDDGQPLGQWNPYKGSKREEFARSALIVAAEDYMDDQSDSFGETTAFRGVDDRNEPQEPRWTLIVGGSKGSLFQRGIAVDPRTGFLDEDRPFVEVSEVSGNAFKSIRIQDEETSGMEEDTREAALDAPGAPQKIRPNHLGPVVDLASPAPGLFISGSHDGTMRVWSLGAVIKPDNDVDSGSEEADSVFTGNVADLIKKIEKEIPSKKPKVLYALSGYKVWLGSIFANSRKLVSDGADNSIIVHSFDEDEEDVIQSREDDDEDDIDDSGDFAYD
jgi:hypothetical protein